MDFNFCDYPQNRQIKNLAKVSCYMYGIRVLSIEILCYSTGIETPCLALYCVVYVIWALAI